MNKLQNDLRGVFFGQAYADALGLCTEFMSKDQVNKNYPKNRITISDMVSDDHRDTWELFDWTDDTDQMILVARAIKEYKEKKESELSDLSIIFAKHLSDWYYNGFPELGDKAGAGIGTYMGWVIKEPMFTKNPLKVSNKIWKLGGSENSEDGSIMRTGIIGATNLNFDEKLNITEIICKTTHADPRCVAGCIYVVVCISLFCEGNKDIINVMEKAKEIALSYICEETQSYYRDRFLKYIKLQNIKKLDLNKGTSRSSVKNPLRCLIYTLDSIVKYRTSYNAAIQLIVKQGGDADTNAAVVGAVLGAYYGYDNICDIANSVLHNAWLSTQANMLINLI